MPAKVRRGFGVITVLESDWVLLPITAIEASVSIAIGVPYTVIASPGVMV